MEDYIPLLIIILISIVGALSRKKKRREQENISKPLQQEQNDDDILGWLEKLNIDRDDSNLREENLFSNKEKDEVVSPTLVNVEEPVKNEAISGLFSQYSGFISPDEREEMVSKEGISVVNKMEIVEGDLTKKASDDSGEIEKKPKFEFDLKKAVIYNEIINRKYI